MPAKLKYTHSYLAGSGDPYPDWLEAAIRAHTVTTTDEGFAVHDNGVATSGTWVLRLADGTIEAVTTRDLEQFYQNIGDPPA